MTETWYLTTPIYYVNDVPHIGHAYTTVVADFLARWQRLHGRPTHFLTGTDEHGAKQATAAAAAGKTPTEWVDSIVPRWRELWERLRISNDDFIRTTERRHEEQVVPFMEKLRAADDVYLGTYEGWYCVRCEEFKTDTELVDGNCPIHGSPAERVQEDNWFFRLSRYNEALLDLYTRDPAFLRPERAYNEMLARLKDGLRDIPISRPSVEWGIPIPWDREHVIYVWIEALQNYITAIGYASDPDAFARIWPANLHLVGKEIVWHHAVVWPAMLLSAGLALPERVFAHGWLLAGGEKISKSGRSITQISPHELIDTYGVDAYRFHFLRAVTFGEDGNFSLEDMQARYTADLANDLGNLASRTIAMIERYFDGRVPDGDAGGDPEAELGATVAAAGPDADALVGDLRVTQALDAVWRIVRHANRYLVEREPWKLAKDEANRPTVGAVLHATALALATVAGLLSPVMPGAMAELWSRLGYDGAPALDPPSPAGNLVRTGDPLFPRIETPEPA